MGPRGGVVTQRSAKPRVLRAGSSGVLKLARFSGVDVAGLFFEFQNFTATRPVGKKLALRFRYKRRRGQGVVELLRLGAVNLHLKASVSGFLHRDIQSS